MIFVVSGDPTPLQVGPPLCSVKDLFRALSYLKEMISQKLSH